MLFDLLLYWWVWCGDCLLTLILVAFIVGRGVCVVVFGGGRVRLRWLLLAFVVLMMILCCLLDLGLLDIIVVVGVLLF